MQFWPGTNRRNWSCLSTSNQWGRWKMSWMLGFWTIGVWMHRNYDIHAIHTCLDSHIIQILTIFCLFYMHDQVDGSGMIFFRHNWIHGDKNLKSRSTEDLTDPQPQLFSTDKGRRLRGWRSSCKHQLDIRKRAGGIAGILWSVDLFWCFSLFLMIETETNFQRTQRENDGGEESDLKFLERSLKAHRVIRKIGPKIEATMLSSVFQCVSNFTPFVFVVLGGRWKTKQIQQCFFFLRFKRKKVRFSYLFPMFSAGVFSIFPETTCELY